MRTNRPSKLAARVADSLSVLHPLEPRQMMAFAGSSMQDALNLPTELFGLSAPDGAVVENFGWTSVALGDLDGDGKGDFAVSAPGRVADASGPAVSGAVFIYSGADRELITTLQGTVPLFGFSLLNVGDLDGDGTSELAVGSPQAATVRVYSAMTGDVRLAFTGNTGSEFGYALAMHVYAREDGDPSLVIGAPSHGTSGGVFAYELATSQPRFGVEGQVVGERFGHALAAGNSVAVGAPAASDAGRLYVLSPDDGEVDRVVPSTKGFGSAVVSLPRPIGIGSLPVWLVGDTGSDAVGDERGRAVSVSFFQNQPVNFSTVLEGDEASLGSVIFEIGDLDGRRGSEFGVGAPGATPSESAFYVYSSSGHASPRLEGVTGFGALGDVDGDGFADVLRTGLGEGGEVRAVAQTAFEYFQLYRPNVVSRDGTFLAYNGVFEGAILVRQSPRYVNTAPPEISIQPYAIRNGVIMSLNLLPGMGENMEITALGDDGTIAGSTITPNPVQGRDRYRPERLDAFVIIDGVRHILSDGEFLVNAPGDLDFARMHLKRVGPTGDVLIEERSILPATSPRAWILSAADHTLTLLWNGYVDDQASDGTVLGAERADENPDTIGTTSLWTRGGGKVAIPLFFNASRINDAHKIFGVDAEGNLAVYRDGQVATIARSSDIVPDARADWVIVGIDERGRGLARFGHSNRDVLYFIGEDNGVAPVNSLVLQGTPPVRPPRYPDMIQFNIFAMFNGTGELLIDHVLLREIDASDGLVADSGGVRSVASGPGGMQAVAVNLDGIPVSFRLVGDRWQGRALDGLNGVASADGDLAVFVDPKDGSAYAVAIGREDGERTLILYRQRADGTFADAIALSDITPGTGAIASHLTVFVAADNRVHIVGLNDDGELIMAYQTGQTLIRPNGDVIWEWFYQNMETTHLAEQGQPTPAWVDDLTVYVTPWNGLNIAGVTANGDVEVVWWAPGRELWSADNLSEITGLTKLVGGLTSYVTPWGGLNIAGIDTSGDLQVVWWVPEFQTQWRSTNMTEEFEGRKLAPATVSSYVTPWGGLNIVGIDADNGDVVVYWWAPTMIDWTAEPMAFNQDPNDPLPTSRLLAVNNGQQLNLFGQADSGEVIRLYWNPGDGATWGLQNLTRISV